MKNNPLYFILLSVMALILILAVIYDSQINKENAISDSTAVELNNELLFENDTLQYNSNYINHIYNNLTDNQIYDIIYNMDMEEFDTISKTDVVMYFLTEDFIPIPENNTWKSDLLKKYIIVN